MNNPNPKSNTSVTSTYDMAQAAIDTDEEPRDWENCRLLSGIVGSSVVTPLAVAQSSSELLEAGLCNRWVAPAAIAVWGLGVLYLTGIGIFRFVNGWRKSKSGHSAKILEGRKEMKRSFFPVIAAILVVAAERLFAFLVVDLVSCVSALL